MANLSIAEKELFGSFYGVEDLIDNDDFWFQVQVLLLPEDKELVLPIGFHALTVRRVLGMLDCKPGACGLCCHYQKVTISETDIEKIASRIPREELAKFIRNEGEHQYLWTENGCPFLKDNICTIYECRPDVCYMYPIMGGIDCVLNGQPFQAMRLRLKCLPALNVARTILRESLRASNGTMRLLPDLSIVPIKQEEK